MKIAQASPRLQLETLFITDARQRIVSTREPYPSRGPAFIFIRGEAACAWAVGADVPEAAALELHRLASEEVPSLAWDRPLRHADRYAALLGGRIRAGPAFAFPEDLELAGAREAVTVCDEAELRPHFSGWMDGEIAAGRAPVLAVREGGHAVSVCFCARRSMVAAEAGIETAPAFRGQGYAQQTAIVWARQVRAQGLTPLYSTDWSNHASLGVARKLKLVPFATDFSVES
jgi:RimJ/RimL family protein N-acetyltransferase